MARRQLGVLFSHPKDFTPVCTTELGDMARLKPEFDKRGVKIIGLSVDPVDVTRGWSKDIEETQGAAPNFPMIGDPTSKVAKLYGMLPAERRRHADGRTAADNATVRNVYVIGPDKKIKLMLAYPMTTGRNFDEMLRVIDSLQLTAKHKVATPANWKHGEDVIIAGSVCNEDGARRLPSGLEGAEALHPHRPAAAGLTIAVALAVAWQGDDIHGAFATLPAQRARGHGTAPAPASLDRPPTRPVQRTAELGGSSRCGPVIDWTASAGALPGGPPWLLTTTNVRVAQPLHRPNPARGRPNWPPSNGPRLLSA